MSDLLGLVQALQMAMKARLMYTASHPRAQDSLESLTQLIEDWLQVNPTLHLATSGGKVFLDGVPFEGQSLHLTATARMLADRQISGVVFSRGITPAEVHEVLELFILKPARIEEQGGAGRILEDKRLTHVQLSQTQYREVREGEADDDESTGPAMRPRALHAAEPAPPEPQPEPKRPDLTPTFDALQALVDQWRNEFRHLAEKAPGWPGDGPSGGGPGPGGPGRGQGAGPGGGASGPSATGAANASTGIELDLAFRGPAGAGIGPDGPSDGAPGSGGPGGGPGTGPGGPSSGAPGLGGPGGGPGIGLGGPASGAPGLGGLGIGPGGPSMGAPGAGGPGGGLGTGLGGPSSGAPGAGGPGGGPGIGLGGPSSGAPGPGGPGGPSPGEPGPGLGLGGSFSGAMDLGGTGAGRLGFQGGYQPIPGPADLSFLARAMAVSGLGEGFPPAPVMEGLRQSLLELPPRLLLSVVSGLDTLPRAPGGLRIAFQALAPELFARGSADLIAQGEPWVPLREQLHHILNENPAPQGLLTALARELKRRGMGLENLNELVARMDWDALGVDEKLRLIADHDHLWKLSHEQRLEFLRRLLDDGRLDAFTALLGDVIEGLEAEDPGRRELAVRTLAGVAQWLAAPGLPGRLESTLLEALAAHFDREPFPQLHRVCAEAIAAAIAGQIERGDPDLALVVLRTLESASPSREPWRAEAMAWLWTRLALPAALNRVLDLLHAASPETLAARFIPYLEQVGAEAARRLVEVLGEEQDRRRRIRLVEVIRGLGAMAIPAVHDSLASEKWYLVRNTLNLLADMGDTEALKPAEACLAHPDGRVRRSAVRAVWKLGGANSVPALLTAFAVADQETALEIMFAFGQIRSAAAIPALGQFAADRRITERLRARAAETLGMIGHAQAIPLLEDLIRRKGRVFTTAEPTEIRLAACKALAALHSVTASAVLRGLVAAEPRNSDRPLMQAVAEQARP